MKKLMGYFWAINNYLKTPKARYDAKDYCQAFIIISLIIVLILIIMSYI